MQNWFDGSPSSINGLSARSKGTGQTLSLEGSYPISIGYHLTFQPEVQFIYQHLDLDPTRDIVSSVTFAGLDAWSGRIGGRLQGHFVYGGALWQPFLNANVRHTFDGHDTVTFAGTDVIGAQRIATALELGGGVVTRFSNAVGAFVSASYGKSLDGNRLNTVQGNLGLKVSW